MEIREQKKFGFGCMRLPLAGDKIDYAQMNEMVDHFMEAGFTYFDTAHGYHSGMSEPALRECLVKRYPRDSYTLTNKLTQTYFGKEEDIRPFFESQLALCGVEYFDYYLMHALTAEFYPKYKECRAFEIAQELKEEGKIRHVGISFHDRADVLDQILSEHPEIEVVQLQFNYADYEHPGVESGKCYEVCEKHKKPVIVMEPVRGGILAHLPKEAGEVLEALHGGSQASYAIRFAASFPNVVMVLSGMSTLEQMDDNVSFMKEFRPLNEEEQAAVARVREILKAQRMIDCTGCRYCTDGCPMKIRIPDLFACYNSKMAYQDTNSSFYYGVHTSKNGKASACIECGRCEEVCPQHLKIRSLLKEVAGVFEMQS